MLSHVVVQQEVEALNRSYLKVVYIVYNQDSISFVIELLTWFVFDVAERIILGTKISKCTVASTTFFSHNVFKSFQTRE